MRGEEEMYRLILETAYQDPLVRAVILNGSRANPDAALDPLRDFDIVYLVTDVAPYKEGDISSRFGEILVMERTDESELYGDHLPNCAAYLMQFSDGNRIDLTVARLEDYEEYCFGDRLSVVLFDKDNALPPLLPPQNSTHWIKRPSRRLFQECRTEFWWTAPYVSKALLRGQLSYAQNHLETCTRAMLRMMLGWLAGAAHGFEISIGKYGDELGKYLPPSFWERYLSTYSRCDRREIEVALFRACGLFAEATQRAAEKLGFPYDGLLDRRVTAFLREEYPKIARLPWAESWDGEIERQITRFGGPALPKGGGKAPKENKGKDGL